METMRFLIASTLLSAAMATSSPAAEATYQLLTDPSAVSRWPGADGLIGTGDDIIDGTATTIGGSGPNTVGGFSHVSFDFGTPGGDPKLSGDFDAISFFSNGSFTFDAAGGTGSALITAFDIVSGTEPFTGHGPYSATTSGPVTGSSGTGTFAVTGAPYDTVINGNPDSATMSFSGTYAVVDPNGAATGNSYYDNVLTPVALANGAVSYVVLLGTGTSGAATNFNFPNMPIQVSLVGFELGDPPADTTYRIDLDNSGNGGPFTETGWTSLAFVNSSTSGAVTVDGVTFSFSGFVGTRNRGEPNTTPLTRDFVFTEDGSAITVDLGGAGDLPAGTWEVSIWSWDSNVPVPPATVGYKVNGGADQITGTGLTENRDDPVVTFQFTSDGVSSYQVFIRDDSIGDGNDRVRLNALSLKLVPASTTLSDFNYNPADGASEVTIQGDAGARYKLVEAADLDFSTPDQDPIPLTGASVGTLDGDAVVADAGGTATVQFNLGTSTQVTFLRAETAP